jgi:hypothetical protein
MGDISIKGRSPIIRQGYKSGGTVKVRDINKDGKKEGWEVARAKGMAKGMGKKVSFKRGGDVSKRTSPKKDKVIQGIKKGIKKFSKESVFIPGAVEGAKKILKGFKDRKRMKQNEKFKRIADEGREKIRTRRAGDRTKKADGGSAYHTTKEGKRAKKGLWYNIHKKRERGERMRKKGAKGAPTNRAIRRSQS